MTEKFDLACDTECYHHFWAIGFRRISDGYTVKIELSRRTPPEEWEPRRNRIRDIMRQHRIIGYNLRGYDNAMIAAAISGATNAELKLNSDRIIQGNVKPWDQEALLGVTIPRNWDTIDLIEPQPNAFASLKTLNGRLHGKKLQDLPFDPDHILTDEDMDALLEYLDNDLDATCNVWHALEEPINSRIALGDKHCLDLRSKSDAQVGEAIIKKRVEQITGQKVQKVETPPGTLFKYRPPEFLRFERDDLSEILSRLRTTDFIVKANGKVDLPDWLDGKHVPIGESVYAMGIGGLHSTEAKRSVYADHVHAMEDVDVAAYYPEIILRSGLYPKALGPHFTTVYGDIKQERVDAKRRAKLLKRELESSTSLTSPDITSLRAALAAAIEADKGGKIQINGCFGKLGSPYSILYAPHLMLYITLTGQLSLLMLIERIEGAGFAVVSANTDGLVIRYERTREAEMRAILSQWESETGFELESTKYRSLHNLSVNTYIAITEDGKAKRKGPLANPRADGDTRGQLMINPSMNICADAATEYLKKRTPVEETIRACKDIREFVTVQKVQGGGTWKGKFLGKTVRYIWSRQGEPIFYKDPHPTTGNFKKVSKTDGCRPVMELPEEVPIDIDYDRYIAEAKRILVEVGAVYAPPELTRRPRVLKRNAREWLWLAAAA